MVGKIVESLNKVNSFSKNIIKVGCYISLFLCVAGMILVSYNRIVNQEIGTYTLGSTMIYTAAVFFAQMVIGGLIIDFFGTVIGNHDD